MSQIGIRPATPTDLEQIAQLCAALWPDATAEEHAQAYAPGLAGQLPTILPWALFVAEAANGEIAGFVEVDLRSHADGCDPSQPTGFLEGWFVREEYRRLGVGGQLVRAAENWARSQGCKEMGSDTWIDHTVSQDAHAALGYEVVDRCVHFRKPL